MHITSSEMHITSDEMRTNSNEIYITPGTANHNGRPPRQYSPALQQALIILWEASDRACGKRLKGLLSALLPALEHHQYLTLQPEIRAELFSVSAATIDRLLRDARSRDHAARGSRVRAVPRRAMHVRMDCPWRDPQPGCLYMDLTRADRRGAADRVRTLTITDMYSGWTQCATVTDWNPGAVVQDLDAILGSLPFVPRRLALDERSTAVRDWLMRPGTDHPMEVIEVSRPMRSRSDLAGQDPIGSRLSVTTSLYANVFLGAFNLASLTPCARLLASGALTHSQQVHLRDHARSLDPLELLAQIRALNSQPRERSSAKSRSMPQPPPADVPNRRRPRQRSLPVRPRSWSTHPNVFQRALPAIQDWLQDDPTQTAKTLLERLKRKFPGVYRDEHLRSLHRRVKLWRQRAGAPI